jgi:hypothetical protein
MAYRQKLSKDTKISIPGGIPTLSKVISVIKQQINHEQFDFYELEPFEVTKVLLDVEDLPLQKDKTPDYTYYGSIAGRFVINKTQSILPADGPQLVKSLDPRIKNYPVVGELTVVANYNGQSYYWNTLNNFNLVNENSVPGISYIGTGETPPTARTKFGKRFERNSKIRQVKAEEGDLILHGRFGNSINLGSKDNNSLIKIRSGQRTDVGPNAFIGKDTGTLTAAQKTIRKLKNTVNRGGPIPEDIDKDKNSIYLSTHGKHTITNTNKKYSGPLTAEGNCIILNSDSLVFNARDGNVNIRTSGDLILEANGVNINAKSGNTIKMGDPRGVFMPTIDAMVMMEFMTEVIDVLNKGFAAIGKATNPPGLVSAAKDIATIVAKQIPRILEILTQQLFFNKSVMVQDPRFVIPENITIPEVDDIAIPEMDDIAKVPTLGDIPGVDVVESNKTEQLKGLKLKKN